MWQSVSMTLLQKIEKLIKDKGLTQETVEQSCGLSHGRISKWKDGVGEPTAKQAWRLAMFLGVAIEYLVNDDIDKPFRVHGLNEDESTVLRTMSALGLDGDEAIRRLAKSAVVPISPRPMLPDELNPPETKKGRGRA